MKEHTLLTKNSHVALVPGPAVHVSWTLHVLVSLSVVPQVWEYEPVTSTLIFPSAKNGIPVENSVPTCNRHSIQLSVCSFFITERGGATGLALYVRFTGIDISACMLQKVFSNGRPTPFLSDLKT